MKFTSAFKNTLTTASVKLDTALAALPDFSAIQIDTSKLTLTGAEITELSLQAIKLRDILSSLKDANERMKAFVANMETTA